MRCTAVRPAGSLARDSGASTVAVCSESACDAVRCALSARSSSEAVSSRSAGAAPAREPPPPFGTKNSTTSTTMNVATVPTANRPLRRPASAARAPSHSGRDATGGADEAGMEMTKVTSSVLQRRSANGRPMTRPPVALNSCVCLRCDRDRSLHVHREMRRAVDLVLAGLDAGERDRDRVADVEQQRARELAELVRTHVRVELALHVGGNQGRIEGNVVRRDRDDRELDSVARSDREIGGNELIGVAVAYDLHFPRLARDGERRTSRGRSRCGSRRCRRRRRRRCILLGTTNARAENNSDRDKRYTEEPHYLRPPEPNTMNG